MGVSWPPLHHDMGLIGNLLASFYIDVLPALPPPELFVAESARRGYAPAPLPRHSIRRALRNFVNSATTGFATRTRRRGPVVVECLSLNGAEVVGADVQRRFSERFERWGFDQFVSPRATHG